jgi:DNA invertase Pin-like site-specific DNA recombinase
LSVIGYARTSTADQTAGLADQIAALKVALCHKIVVEETSAVAQRPKLDSVLYFLSPGDVLTVTKLDRRRSCTTTRFGDRWKPRIRIIAGSGHHSGSPASRNPL